MDFNEFKEYLRGQYRPDPGQDEEGGFLVPNVVMADKAGLLAKIYRWVGRLLRNKRLYKKGTYDVDFKAELMQLLAARHRGLSNADRVEIIEEKGE